MIELAHCSPELTMSFNVDGLWSLTVESSDESQWDREQKLQTWLLSLYSG